MANFTAVSRLHLVGVHPRLVQIAEEVTQDFDCSVLSGLRSTAEQAEDVKQGLSLTMDSQHLMQADGYGHALDLAPTPQRWDDPTPSSLTQYQVECIAFLFYLKGYARARGLALRIGADWKGTDLWYKNSFNDLDHAELENATESTAQLPPPPEVQ